MIGATLYLVGRETSNGKYVENANSCIMCKRLSINAGIKEVVIRDTKDKYRIIDVEQWIKEDDYEEEELGY